MKKCAKCGELKPYTTFNKTKRYKDGYGSWCKSCQKQYRDQYNRDNPEYQKQYRIKHRKKTKQYNKEYQEHNKEKERIRSIKRYAAKVDFVSNFKEKCVICGFSEKPALVFHHRNPQEKKFTISNPSRTNTAIIEKEIAKCVVLCANCHLIFHYYEHHPSERSTSLLKKYQDLGLTINDRPKKKYRIVNQDV